MSKLKFVSHSPKSVNKPKALVMLLHGYGSNARDLISLAPDLENYIEDAIFISPNAPFRFEGGTVGAYQWYGLSDRSNASILEGYQTAKPILDAFIKEQLHEHNLTMDKLILMGFSQGGMMTLHYGSESKDELMGIVSFSGYIINDGNFAAKVGSKPRTLITHGDFDMVVPFEAYKYAVGTLKELDFPVTGYQASGLGHGIDYGCLGAAQEFFKRLG